MTYSSDVGWWERPWLLVTLVLIAAVPMLWPVTPPLIDLPDHMARFEITSGIQSSSPLNQFFEVDWKLIPNLGVDLLVLTLAPLVGVELAVKSIVIVIPVLTASGLLWISREVHGRIPATTLFALPLAYGYPFLYGFVNYCLASGLALLSFGLWLRLGTLGRPGLRAVLFLLISPIVWISHIYGWGILGILVFGSETVRQGKLGRGWRRSMWHAALQCLPLAAPLFLMMGWRGQSGGLSEGWFDWQLKAKWLLGLFRDRWMALDLISAAVVYGILATALICRRWLRVDWTLGLPALMLWFTFAVLPTTLFGSYFASVRLVPYAAAISLLALQPTLPEGVKHLRWLAASAAAFYVVRLGTGTASAVLYDSAHRAELQALNYVERGSRVVALVGQPCGNQWLIPRLTNLPSMAIVRRHAFVNGQFAAAGGQNLQIKYRRAGFFTASGSQKVSLPPCNGPDKPLSRSLSAIPRPAFDYLWIINVSPNYWPRPAGLRPLWHRGNSILYRIEKS